VANIVTFTLLTVKYQGRSLQSTTIFKEGNFHCLISWFDENSIKNWFASL